MEVLTLLSLAPRDRRGPVSWRALVSDGERIAREIFASPQWSALDESSLQLARSAANRVLLDTAHTGLRAERTWSLDADRDTLESHLIDAKCHKALADNDVPSFLQHRAARLRGAVSLFLTRAAGLGAPRLRPVESYYDAEA